MRCMNRAEQLQTLLKDMGLDIGYYDYGQVIQLIIRDVNNGYHDSSVIFDFKKDEVRVWIDE